MSKLLRGNFARLRKSKLFWCGVFAMAVYGALMINTQYSEYKTYGFGTSLDKVFFGYTAVIGVITAVFSSIFLGNEYHDGTIRNKIIMGHSRINIYVSNLILNIAAALFCCFVFLLIVAAVGIPLIGGMETENSVVAKMLLGTVFLVVSYCSVFTMVSMIFDNKAAAAVIALLLIMGLLIMATYLDARLGAPEYVKEYTINNGVQEMKEVLNPQYLSGEERKMYEIFYDFLPTGQSIQYMTMSVLHLWMLPLYSFIITVVTTITGIFSFHKKNIK